MHSHNVTSGITLAACIAATAVTTKPSRKIREITYTEEELQYMAMNKCNKGYHYLGSAKILGRIGEAFAKAVIEIQHP